MPVARAKFTVTAVTNHDGGNQTVKLEPRYSDKPEDKTFWKYTPSGHIEFCLSTDAPVKDAFKPGQTFFVDFTPVE